MDKFWENYITTRPVDSKGAFDAFKQMNQDPRPTIPGPRYAKAEFSPVFDPDLEQSEFLRPGETLEDWKPNPFLKPHAEGGRAGYTGGGPIDVLDPQFKLADAIKAYQDYYSGSGKKKRKIPFKTFFRIYAKENFAEGGSAGQLVRNTVDGSRPGYNGPPSVVGRPRGFDIKAVEKAINSANSKFKYTSLDNLAKQIDGVSDASHLKGIIKRQNLPGLDSYAIKAEKAFIELFKDSSRNADEVIKPLHKIADMIGVSGGKERVRIENISNALKKSKILNYAEDVKPLINKLSSANFIKKIQGKEWRIFDVESSIYTKSMLRAPKTDVEHLMNYVIRHQDQAGGDAVFNIFDQKSGKRITDMSNIESYHDIIFKDSKGKTYDMDYLLRNSKTDPMFKEYYNIQDQLKVMRDKKYWPDGSKIIDPKTGKHVTFGNYSGSMHQHGYGWKKPYERFAYETDHLNLKKHPFKNLTILPQRINIAIGAADRLKKPDIKYKLGGEHFRNLNVDDLMMQEKALGEKILLFDNEGTHIGKKLNTPYTAAKIKLGSQKLYSFPANLAKNSKFGKLGKGIKLVAKGEALFAPLFLYGGAAYGLPFTRNINEASYGILGKSKSEYLINKSPKAKKVIDLLDAEAKYNTLLENYNNGSAMDKMWFKDKMLAKQKEFEEKVAAFNAIPEEEKMELGQAYQTAEQNYEDEIKQRRDRHFSNYIIPKKEFFTDIGSNISDAFTAPVSASENVFGTSIPTGKVQTEFAKGGIADLTRTVAPDSGPMDQGLRSLYINDKDY